MCCSSGFTIYAVRIVPNYELAPDLENVEILRIVVRENMSETVCMFESVRKCLISE